MNHTHKQNTFGFLEIRDRSPYDMDQMRIVFCCFTMFKDDWISEIDYKSILSYLNIQNE